MQGPEDAGRGLQVAKASKGSKPRQATMMTMMKSKRKRSCSRTATGTVARAEGGAGRGGGQETARHQLQNA